MASETVGQRIVALRALQRVKGAIRPRADLARAIGMDERQLARIEKGDIEPRVETIEKIAVKGFGLPVAAIADPAYYTVAQLELARREYLAAARTDEERRLGAAAFEAQVRAAKRRR